MGKQEFEKFLQNQAETYQTVDNEALLHFWRAQLDILYAAVQSWLAEYAGKIRLSFADATLMEEGLGSYTVLAATISIGTQQARLMPIGTRIIGSRGRVDLIGPAGSVKLLLADKDATEPRIMRFAEFSSEANSNQRTPKRQQQTLHPTALVWKATTPAPRIKYRDLTQDVFLDCLIGVLNG